MAAQGESNSWRKGDDERGTHDTTPGNNESQAFA